MCDKYNKITAKTKNNKIQIFCFTGQCVRQFLKTHRFLIMTISAWLKENKE